jgi:hypothetical protein
VREDGASPEFVADELKKLVGKRDPYRFGFPPRLMKLAGVDGDPMDVADATVRRFLVEGIATLSGLHRFDGRQHKAEVLQKVFVGLLNFEDLDLSADIRRYDAITELECFCSITKWRKVMEYKLMLILAYHLTRTPSVH